MIDFLAALPCYAPADLIDANAATIARVWSQIVLHSIIDCLDPM